MAWIKRNLFFAIGGILALILLGAAGFYNFQSWHHNASTFAQLDAMYTTLKGLNDQRPSPGNEKVDNIAAAKEQERQLRDWISQAENYFVPIPSIPDNAANGIASEEFASSLHRTIDVMQHEAANSSVGLPPQYMFSFKAESTLVKFAPGSLPLLAAQLGEVKAICEVFYEAKVNAFDGIQRERVSDDDANGPQSDYHSDHTFSTDLATLTPYIVTFRCFGPEFSKVMAGFANSHHGFVIKAMNVSPAGATPVGVTAGAMQLQPWMPGAQQEMARLGMGGPPAPAAPAPTRGGLQTVLDEQLLQVTMAIEVVKLSQK